MMKLHSLVWIEFIRLLRNRLAWLVSAVALFSPAAGLWLYRQPNGYSGLANGTYLANPALAGALLGALAFALLTAAEMNRIHRVRGDELCDAIASPLAASLARSLALAAAAVVVQAIAMAVWLPIAWKQIGSAFDGGLFVAVFMMITLPAWLFAAAFTAIAYHVTRRLDFTLLSAAAFVWLSLTVWHDHWLLRWVNPPIHYLSDDFGNLRLLLSLAWNRLFWTLLLGGGWLFSFLAIRRYGRGLAGSIVRNSRNVFLPVSAALLIFSGVAVYNGQPFLDHSKLEIDMNALYGSMPFNEQVSYSSMRVEIEPDVLLGRQRGTMALTLHNEGEQTQTVAFRINPGYTFTSVTANGKTAMFRDLADDDQNGKTMEIDLPAEREIELKIRYGGFPQEWNLLELMQGESEISRDYVYLSNEGLAPAPWGLMPRGGQPLAYSLDVRLPEGMTPVPFGLETAVRLDSRKEDGVLWRFESDVPLSILYAGDYESMKFLGGGIEVEFFYSAKRRSLLEKYDADETLAQVFDYCTERYGPLRFAEEGKMRIIEIGSKGGGYASHGVSVMSETSFNEQSLSDTRKGAGGDEVLAHEIIHQWWGLGRMFSAEDEQGAWSSEGLTVYTSYRLMKELYGETYAKKNYVDQWQADVDDYYDNYYIRNPEQLEKLPEKYRAMLRNRFMQVRHYSEMPLIILKAEKLVGGEAQMDRILRELFNRETDPVQPFLTFQQFIDACGLREEVLLHG